jgi:hypothetical protein
MVINLYNFESCQLNFQSPITAYSFYFDCTNFTSLLSPTFAIVSQSDLFYIPSHL